MAGSNVRFGSKADMCSALGDVRFVPIVDIASSGSVRQKPQPCSRGFACDGAVKGQTKTTPRHVQLDSTPTDTFAAMLPLVIGTGLIVIIDARIHNTVI